MELITQRQLHIFINCTARSRLRKWTNPQVIRTRPNFEAVKLGAVQWKCEVASQFFKIPKKKDDNLCLHGKLAQLGKYTETVCLWWVKSELSEICMKLNPPGYGKTKAKETFPFWTAGINSPHASMLNDVVISICFFNLNAIVYWEKELLPSLAERKYRKIILTFWAMFFVRKALSLKEVGLKRQINLLFSCFLDQVVSFLSNFA